MARRQTLWLSISLLGLVLLGTLFVLSAFSYYLAINDLAYVDEREFGHRTIFNNTNSIPSSHTKPSQPVERIPRILHQTWKTETLPDRWKGLSQGCRDLHPDYEYILWTDASSREFIAKEYPWFLDTFDDYRYPIQRADAIRYFILHHYGGIYLDLDIGCLRPMDPLLVHPVILPKTIPVGVSNDLMFAEKGHPFMAQTIHNLVTFDHSWYLNYPTVMFSTGPMFLSAQYGVYTTAHPAAPEHPGGEVRILPKALYGKNAKPHEAPHAFFAHYYGSSWHSDDAAFVGFLGQWGKGLMFVGAAIVVLGLFRLALPSQHARSRKRGRAYEVVPLHWSQRHGRYQLDLGWFTLPVTPATRPPSPLLPPSPVPSLDEEDMLSLPYPSLPFDLRSRPPSPAPSDRTDIFPSSGAVVDAALRLGGRLATFFGPSDGHDPDGPHQPFPRRAAPSRRVLFMPAVFAPASAEYELPLRRPHRRPRSPPPRYTSPAPTATGGPSSGESKSGQRFGVDEENGLLGISGIGRSEVGSRISSRAITPAATPARIPSSEQPLDAFFDGGQSNMLFPGARTPGSRTPQGSRPSSRLA